MTTAGFWRDFQPSNQQLSIGNFKGVANQVHYLFPDGNGPGSAFTTFAALSPHLRSRDVIILGGVLREQAVAPLGVFDVYVVGAANRPRQATSGGVPTGGGASWLAPTSPVATTPLIELREQGWMFENIQFAGPSDDACIKMHREETATYPDASHLTLRGCRFTGGLIGLEDYGGASNVLIEGCSFEDLAGVGGGAIVVTNQGIAIPSRWMFQRNRILPSVNGIVGAFVDSQFLYNVIAKSTTTTLNLASGNTGLRNFIMWNHFNIAAADFDPAGGVTGNATDTWVNWLADVLEFGVPAN
jgi:hypothetical protein